MAESIPVKRKKPGRPATGTEPLYGVRIGDQLMTEIMHWAEQNGDLSRSEAVRCLVEMGLTVKSRPKQTARADKAKAMAGKHLDRLVDVSASSDEQAIRKRRLLSGPEEFRSVRVDRPAKK
jgi:hypothetical protein